MSPVNDTIEATVSAVASKATWTGSAVTVLSGLTASDIGLWAGILIGVAGLLVNGYFKHRADKRNQAAHIAFMATLQLKEVPPFQEEKDDL